MHSLDRQAYGASAGMGEGADAVLHPVGDTLEFRSPTTTQEDRAIAHALADDLGVGYGRIGQRHVRCEIGCFGVFKNAELLADG